MRNSLVHTPWCAPDSLHFGGWLYSSHFLDRESPSPFWWSLTHPSKPSCKEPCTVMVPSVLWKWSHLSFSELIPEHSLLSGCHAYLNTLQLQLGFELSKRFAFAPLLPSNTRSIDIVGDQVLKLKITRHLPTYGEELLLLVLYVGSLIPRKRRVDLKQKQRLENIISSKLRSLMHLWGWS